MIRDRQPKHVRQGGEFAAKANPEFSFVLPIEDTSLPPVTNEERRLQFKHEEVEPYGSRRDRTLARGPYRAPGCRLRFALRVSDGEVGTRSMRCGH